MCGQECQYPCIYIQLEKKKPGLGTCDRSEQTHENKSGIGLGTRIVEK